MEENISNLIKYLYLCGMIIRNLKFSLIKSRTFQYVNTFNKYLFKEEDHCICKKMKINSQKGHHFL